jgi:hypothetical protein
MLPEPLSHAILGSPTDRLAQGIAAAFRDIPAACLPLQGCCHRGAAIADGSFEIVAASVQADAQQIGAELNVFFTELVDGCNCSDDPVGYPMCCRMRLRIDRTTAKGRLEVLDR